MELEFDVQFRKELITCAIQASLICISGSSYNVTAAGGCRLVEGVPTNSCTAAVANYSCVYKLNSIIEWGLHFEGSATKEISYTPWRNQLKSSWNHEKSKQISLKSSSEISPTLQPHPLLQHMTSYLREITGNQREIRKSRTPKLLVADPSLHFPLFNYM